ncbi:hypothetical protein Sste5346_010263 [Sporothrix stenoceras]|uniref:Maleylacetate reductase n=1 Tax=Sporothrix stenoceras TaxID=5173 RepID=A0ABR3YHS4_9PEZI
MLDFTYKANPATVLFGSGTIRKVPGELARLKLSKPLILCTPQQTAQANDLRTILNSADAADGQRIAVAGFFDQATMHTPVAVTEQAIAVTKDLACDCVVSIGGGSTIGLGKALSVRTGLYHMCIPTTYAGSEMTPILGETQDGRKTTRSDPTILPDSVIYDVDLTMTLPASLSATSGVNAIAHAVEALYARNGNPIINLIAVEGVRALAEALPAIVQDPSAAEPRAKALYGAWLCGTCLGSVGMSLHHKLCHTLGGSFGLSHAETHTVVLPHAVAYNAAKIPEALGLLAQALPDSDGDAIRGLNVLLRKLGVTRDLKTLGLKGEDVSKAADIAVSNPYWNPRDIERAPIEELIRRAWVGEDARADL